jgi:hypothetical protein
MLGELGTCRYRRVGRHLVEIEQLIGTESEDITQLWLDALPSMFGERRERVVEIPPPAEHSRRELMRQAAVTLVERLDRAVAGRIEGGPARD